MASRLGVEVAVSLELEPSHRNAKPAVRWPAPARGRVPGQAEAPAQVRRPARQAARAASQEIPIQHRSERRPGSPRGVSLGQETPQGQPNTHPESQRRKGADVSKPATTGDRLQAPCDGRSNFDSSCTGIATVTKVRGCPRSRANMRRLEGRSAISARAQRRIECGHDKPARPSNRGGIVVSRE